MVGLFPVQRQHKVTAVDGMPIADSEGKGTLGIFQMIWQKDSFLRDISKFRELDAHEVTDEETVGKRRPRFMYSSRVDCQIHIAPSK